MFFQHRPSGFAKDGKLLVADNVPWIGLNDFGVPAYALATLAGYSRVYADKHHAGRGGSRYPRIGRNAEDISLWALIEGRDRDEMILIHNIGANLAQIGARRSCCERLFCLAFSLCDDM